MKTHEALIKKLKEKEISVLFTDCENDAAIATGELTEESCKKAIEIISKEYKERSQEIIDECEEKIKITNEGGKNPPYLKTLRWQLYALKDCYNKIFEL